MARAEPWRIGAGALLALAMAAPVARAQSLDALKQALAQKEAEVAALKARIAQAQASPVAESAPPSAAALAVLQDVQTDEASNRALERTLVREGAALLPAYRVQLTPQVGLAAWDNSRQTPDRDSEYVALTATLGLPWASQLQASLPYVRTATTHGADNGVGSLDLSFSKQLLNEGQGRPSLVASIGGSTPAAVVDLNPARATEGGFSSVYGSLALAKRFDPVVLFADLSAGQTLPRTVGALKYSFAPYVDLNLGGNLALSPQMSLNTAFDFWRRDDVRAAGLPLKNSSVLDGYYSIGLSSVISRSLMIIVTGSTRLLGPGPDFSLNLSFPYQF
jgi:hypothetical protein